jgi:integrase
VVPMFAILAFAGMRIGGLKRPTWEDVGLDHDVIHVHRGGEAKQDRSGAVAVL